MISPRNFLPRAARRFLLRTAVRAADRLERAAAKVRLGLLWEQLAVKDGLRSAGEIFSRSDIFENQIGISARALEEVARKAAKPGMLALEIGSWAGASTGIIGKVVKENEGLLFCVDHWRGNLGLHDGTVDLAAVSRRIDMFRIFQSNVRSLGLEGTVQPLKMSSEVAARILKDECFDLVFIDAEHTYAGIRADIDNYFPKLKRGGILSGHDCEGKLNEFDRAYIDAHKDIDFDRVRKLHCGVIKAVGESFNRYEVKDCVWFLTKDEHSVLHPSMA